MDVPELNTYANAGEIYKATFSNPLWILIFILFCIFWLITRYIGDKLEKKYVKDPVTTNREIFPIGRNVQSLCHTIVASIASIAMFCKYGFDIDAAYNQPNNGVIIFYKVFSIFSAAYFSMTIHTDAMQDSSLKLRILLPIHHSIAILNQSCVFVLDSFGCMVSAMVSQVEIPLFPMAIHEMSEVAQNARWYKISSWGLLIIYPVHRLILMSLGLQRIYAAKDLFRAKTGLEAFYIVFGSALFILLISTVFYLQCLIRLVQQRWKWFELPMLSGFDSARNSIPSMPSLGDKTMITIIDDTEFADSDSLHDIDCNIDTELR